VVGVAPVYLQSAKSRSANGSYAYPPTTTSVFHVSQQIDMAGVICCVLSTDMEPVDGCYTSHLSRDEEETSTGV